MLFLSKLSSSIKACILICFKYSPLDTQLALLLTKGIFYAKHDILWDICDVFREFFMHFSKRTCKFLSLDACKDAKDFVSRIWSYNSSQGCSECLNWESFENKWKEFMLLVKLGLIFHLTLFWRIFCPD